jgi:hypothetical protein
LFYWLTQTGLTDNSAMLNARRHLWAIDVRIEFHIGEYCHIRGFMISRSSYSQYMCSTYPVGGKNSYSTGVAHASSHLIQVNIVAIP